MSDDFGTISIRRGERAREIEVLRQHYRQHRDALARMIADAPTEHLASEYQRLIAEIDGALGKLDELEGRPPGSTSPGAAAVSPPPPPHPARRGAEPVADPRLTGPGNRPLVAAPGTGFDAETPADLPRHVDGGAPRSRVALIVIVALIALAVIGWLIWRASSDRTPERPIVEESTAPDTSIEAATAPAASRELTITPRANDYGTIRKGTRATRQFEVTNNSDEPITLQVSRSACRCLFYEHAPVVPPKAKENITVTIDGARAKAGELHETLQVSAKSNPAITTSIDVTATIR
jgi:hypothetical protein